MAKFIVTEQMYYRQGVKYQPGEVVTLPDGEKPAPHWKKVVEQPTPAKPATVELPSAPISPPAESGKGKKGGGAPNPI